MHQCYGVFVKTLLSEDSFIFYRGQFDFNSNFDKSAICPSSSNPLHIIA